MKNLILLLLLFSSINFFAQRAMKADTLAKYSDREMLKKAMDATLFFKNDLRQIYYRDFFNRDVPNSLKSEAYYTMAFEYYEYTNYGIDYSIELLKKSLAIEKKTGNTYVQILCLDGLCFFYGMKNEDENLLRSLEEMKSIIASKTNTRYEYLKVQSAPYRIYAYIGDFKRANKGYHQSNKEIREYLSENNNLPAEQVEGLTYDMKTNYVRLITNFNYLKQLDSSAYYIKKVKDLEADGFIYSTGIWYQETIYLILKGKYDEAIFKVDNLKKEVFMNSKGEQTRALYCLALCYEQKKDYKKALEYCEEAMKIKALVFSFLNYDLEFLRIASNCSQNLGEIEKVKKYSAKYIETSQKLDYQKKAKFIAKLYDQDLIVPLGNKLKTEQRFSSYYLFGAFFLLAISFYLVWRVIRSQKDKNKFLEIIAQLERKEASKMENEIFANTATEEIQKFEETKSSSSLPKSLNEDTERKILKQLLYFEKKQQFLSPNVTAGSLAADLNTNVVYLSSVIKKYKNNNFNNYINELRIDYIISKLKSNPEYSTYKIAYLAAECGFSSHSNFIRIFTQYKGITPSKFINLLSQYN